MSLITEISSTDDSSKVDVLYTASPLLLRLSNGTLVSLPDVTITFRLTDLGISRISSAVLNRSEKTNGPNGGSG